MTAKTETKLTTEQPLFGQRSITTCVAAWLIPGGGHFALKRVGRGIAGFLAIASLFCCGVLFDGELSQPRPGRILSYAASFACLGLGPGYFVAVRKGVGSVKAPGFEFGSTLLIAGGLLNMLLILDAFDIAVGRKD